MNKQDRIAWHGAGADIRFSADDFEVLDLVLGQNPELRVCAWALKQALAAKVKFPIKSARAVGALMRGKAFNAGGHSFTARDVPRLMPAEHFPIRNEGDLVSRVYIALIRCRHEHTMRAHSSASPSPARGARRRSK